MIPVERDSVREKAEKAILVGVRWGRKSLEEAEDSLLELRSLAETAGACVVGEILQTRSKPEPATLLGRGKLAQLTGMVVDREADLAIFDQELSPTQQRNLENELLIKVVDRTALILDIFAIHAHSKEGKAQVEMAQLRYALTRLTGRGSELSRLLGGIGIRGPGETKLEVDRRRINMRLKTLDRELKDLSKVRKIKRKRREKRSIPTFALVGYTNAGKSSLLNALTGAGVRVEDQLFSTLDPVTRRVSLPGNQEAVITDTVGFINHLPHQLVEAFKSTLEEVRDAEVLLHVIDASAAHIENKIAAVDEVLEEIEADGMPSIYVLNKADLVDEEDRRDIKRSLREGVLVSTLTGEGLDTLEERMAAAIATCRVLTLVIPYDKGDLLSLVYSRGHVLEERSEEDGFYLLAEIPENLYYRVQGYAVAGGQADEEGEQAPRG